MKHTARVFSRRHTLWALIVFVGLILASASIYAIYLYNKMNDTIDRIAAPAASSPTGTKPLQTGAVANLTPVTKPMFDKPLTFLLTAVDERAGSEGSLNTDVMMLFSVDPTTRQATVVSIPRDLEVTAEQSGFSDSHKVNYFYAYYYNQSKDTALSETKKLFSNLYNVPIDYMAVINFDGFRQLIDSLGGMTIDVDMDMKYEDVSDGTNIHLSKGVQHLNGKQVLDFIRYRKSNLGTAESSDLVRNEREQQVLNQLLDQLTSLNGVSAWGKVLDIAGNSVKSDIPADDLRTMTLAYKTLKPQEVNYIHLDGEWESPYVVVKQEDLDQAFAALRTQSPDSIDRLPQTN
ncbi:LCP family protein [Paenibacillus aestuarii]|uniref:LCP family protein n=1 Tax=Paenibacillus aestuarii TaxID=516965 RepID=A0ABW0K4B4_9BACL|nr:LCP family protein [Paenibacillus aestuarii]